MPEEIEFSHDVPQLTQTGDHFKCSAYYYYEIAGGLDREAIFHNIEKKETETYEEFFRRIIKSAKSYHPTVFSITFFSESDRGDDDPSTRRFSLTLHKCYYCHRWTHHSYELAVVFMSDNIWRHKREQICFDCVNHSADGEELFECCFCGGYQQLAYHTTPADGLGGWDSAGEFCCSLCGSNLYQCSECQRWTSENDLTEDGYCPRCAQEREDEDDDDNVDYHSERGRSRVNPDVIHQYSFKPQPIFYSYHGGIANSDKGKVYLGVELEIDDVELLRELADELYEISDTGGLFYLKWDGSLRHGFEIVSQPCTVKYHRAKFPWKEILRRCADHSAKADTINSCGLHIHFNVSSLQTPNATGENVVEEEEFNILKLIAIVERFYSQIEKIARRTENHYCTRNSRNCGRDTSNGERVIRKLFIIKDMKAGAGGRMAVNLATKGCETVELRMFKGTVVYDTLMATLEFVDYLIRFIRDKGITHLSHLTWDRFVSSIPPLRYRYLVKYLKKLGLGDEAE